MIRGYEANEAIGVLVLCLSQTLNLYIVRPSGLLRSKYKNFKYKFSLDLLYIISSGTCVPSIWYWGRRESFAREEIFGWSSGGREEFARWTSWRSS